ncbi:hypothetical protein [Lysinibacillus fusiformis]|uniref:hypothetical protein n=1 Tax=Lysinibacillus fusiformis TaxID=28031 RepID=UPI003CFE7AB8
MAIMVMASLLGQFVVSMRHTWCGMRVISQATRSSYRTPAGASAFSRSTFALALVKVRWWLTFVLWYRIAPSSVS